MIPVLSSFGACPFAFRTGHPLKSCSLSLVKRIFNVETNVDRGILRSSARSSDPVWTLGSRYMQSNQWRNTRTGSSAWW